MRCPRLIAALMAARHPALHDGRCHGTGPARRRSSVWCAKMFDHLITCGRPGAVLVQPPARATSVGRVIASLAPPDTASLLARHRQALHRASGLLLCLVPQPDTMRIRRAISCSAAGCPRRPGPLCP